MSTRQPTAQERWAHYEACALIVLAVLVAVFSYILVRGYVWPLLFGTS